MRAGSFALALCLLTVPLPAWAVPRPPTEAEALFGRGVEAFEAGRYEMAAALMSQAYALEPEARLAFNTALAYERAGRPTEAVTWYELAAAGDEASLRDEAARAIARLLQVRSEDPVAEERTVAREATLSLRLAEAVAGARVQVDGGNALALPGSVRVTPGAHIIEASAPGRQPWRETVTVVAGEAREMEVILAPVVVEAGAPSWWIGAGVTSAAAATGLGFYFVSAGHFDEADRLAAAGVDRVGFDRAQSDGRSAATLSNAAYGVAALAGAVTGLLWWMERDERAGNAGVSVVPFVGPSQAGLLGSWRP